MLSARELALLVEELEGILEGCRVKKIYGIPPGDLLFRFHRDREDDLNLSVVLDSPLPRLTLVDERPDAPRRPAPFVELLRRELKGGRLIGLDTIPGDRVVRMRFRVRSGDGDAEERRVFVELLPALRNLVVTDGANVVKLALRKGSARRPQARDSTYLPPEPPPRRAAPEKDPFAFLGGRPPAGGLSSAIEQEAANQERSDAEESQARVLMDGLRRGAKRLRRLLHKLEAELDSLPDATELRRRGEILKVNLGRIPRRSDSVTLPDWSSGSEELVTIPLDPRLGARGNCEHLFKLAKKADRARPRVEARLAECRERITATQEILARAAEATDPEALEGLAEEARARHLIRSRAGGALEGAHAGQREGAGGSGPRLPYRIFISKDGVEILVGRTAADNDVLTFQVARGNDYWFHVADHPGSHVVVRGDRELPHETLLDAATLAAHYSRGGRGGACDVSWTRRKWVKKFKGARAGQVLLAERKTIRVRPDPERLARLRRRPERP
jgi:predicted ribosome quality control (RQC) complex YloA/Tae2 family protein